MIAILLNFGHIYFLSISHTFTATDAPKFCKFLRRRRDASPCLKNFQLSCHVAGWWHHDPLYPPFNVYGDAYLSTTAAFSRKSWSKIYETFSLGIHTHARTQIQTRSSFSIAVAHLVRRALVNTNCRSIIGFFGGVVGSRRLPRHTTYPRVAALADIWHASTTDTRKPLCMPTTCHLYTSRHYRRSLSAQRGSGSRYFEIQPPRAILASAWRESLFLRRFISTGLSDLLEKYISPTILRNRWGRNKILTVREAVWRGRFYTMKFQLSLGLNYEGEVSSNIWQVARTPCYKYIFQ